MVADWRSTLDEQRKSLGLSRRELARRARLSPATVRAYEEGRRRPKLESLKAILDALRIDRGRRNEILVGAGFAPDGMLIALNDPAIMFTLEETAEEVERYRWPAFVANEVMEVVAANKVAQRLWGVDLDHEFTDSVERNLLSVASNPRFADRCLNWDEAVGIIAAGWREHHRGAEDFESPGPYFAAVLERFLEGDPKYVERLLRLWETAAPAVYHIRWSYPVVWRDPIAGDMRFHCFVSLANEPDALYFNDWIPVDAATWDALDALAGRPRT